MTALYILLLLGAVVSNSLLAYFLARKTDRTGVVTSFIIFLFTINVWAVPQILINTFNLSGDLYSFVNKFSAFGYCFIPTALITFVYAYRNKLDDLRKISSLFFTFVPSFIFLFLALSTNLITVHRSENMINAPWGHISAPGLLFPVFFIWLEFLVFYSLVKLVSYVRETGRKEGLLIVIALLIPLSVGTVTDGILPILGFNSIPLAIPLVTLMAITIGYAIQRYQLFEFSPSTILSSLGEGIITVNEKGRVILVNRTAELMLGQKASDLVGQLFYKKIKLLDQFGRAIPEKDRPISRAVKTKRRLFYKNYFIVPKSGKKFSAAFTISPILKSKKAIGATVNFRDNSIEHEAEKNKDEFISIASHELKTPITALKLYTQLLERQISVKGDKKQLTSVDKINKQTDRLLNLVGDLLNVSRIQTGKFEYNKKEILITDLIDEVMSSVSPLTRGRKITKKLASNLRIYGDMDKLSQVLTNLLTNAIKYSPKEKPILISSRLNKGLAVVSIRDYGPGISKKDQEMIFERFYQGRAGKKKESGIGVGLYLSKEIITDHHGDLSVKSQKGRGTVFSFSLPLYNKN